MEPDTLASHESPLKNIERVADKLHDHLEGHTLISPDAAFKAIFEECGHRGFLF